MFYKSTRGDLEVSFSNSVLWGLTPEGGLIIPKNFPHYSKEDLGEMSLMNYQELAFRIIKDFVDDIPLEDLKTLIEKSYTKELFETEEITPVTKIGEEKYILELFRGPTLAFKDIALQFLGNVFDYVLDKINSTTNILTATSGDTGSAAIHGTKGKKRLRIFVLTPEGRMSKFQTAQMYSVLDSGVFNIAINGTFDDCQDMVKKVSEDVEFRERYHLGYMNSINWSRVLAQIVYYAKGIFAIQKMNNLGLNDQVDVAVPTGNFGDILAGYYAKKIGIPIGKLILATNENDVLDIFFKSGIYKIRKKEDVIITDSPSMDITSASNFERFIYDIVNQNPEVVKDLWKQIKENMFFDISNTSFFENVKESEVVSGSTTKKDRYEIIKKTYDETGIIIDPHTANGVFLADQYKRKGIPFMCLATASPIKFEESIKEALEEDITLERPDQFKEIEKKPQRFIKIERGDTEALKNFIAENSINLI
ncbi:MAG: threonine synthase [Candidatus Pacearchaeota archaeon]|jgi:threonine synthase